MFHRSTITKRIIAFCGVWLTLVSGLQQTHALCGLNGCFRTEKQQVSSECCENGGSEKKCSHSHRCDSQQQARNAVQVGTAGIDRQPAAPCEKGCQCCQAPSPQQVPIPLDAESATQPSAICGGSMLAAAWLGVAPAGSPTTISESSPERAIEVCVRLCRFLA